MPPMAAMRADSDNSASMVCKRSASRELQRSRDEVGQSRHAYVLFAEFYFNVLMETAMADELKGRTVAILLAPQGTEQIEFEQPKQAVEEAGGSVQVVGIEAGNAQAVNNDLEPGAELTVEKSFSD